MGVLLYALRGRSTVRRKEKIMAELLKGAPVAAAMSEKLRERSEALASKGVKPCLAVLRVGSRGDDLAYERGIKSRCDKVGIEFVSCVLPEDASEDDVCAAAERLSADPSVHGILLFSLHGKNKDSARVFASLSPLKDVDGVTTGSMAGIYVTKGNFFAPCTAESCMRILEHYNIPIEGKNVVVVGRSTVIGKPVSMLLLKENATVTICHTRTRDLAEVCRRADILVAAAGRAKMIGPEFMREGQVVVDVGINVLEDGSLCGDVDLEAAEAKVAAVTPVPGGVGSVTTAVLAEHVIEAAERTL